jgi:hypothetical protein
MLIIQNVYSSGRTPRTYATTKIAGTEIGLTLGDRVTIYQNKHTLFYSHGEELPYHAGFEMIMTRKVSFTQNRPQVSLPPDWVKEYCKDCTHVKVFYTDIGLFIKPYYV